MRDDQLALVQETVGHVDGFLDQPAGIVPQVQNQPIDGGLREFRQRLIHFVAGGFVESFDSHVGDAGTQPEGIVHACRAGTLSRTSEKRIGSACPMRRAVMVTGVPFGPFSIPETSVTVACSVLVSLTAMI